MRIAIVCALAVLAGCGEAARAPVGTAPCRPSGECRLTFGGVAREYLRFAPRTNAAGRPLIVVLHGVGPGATPRAAAAETRLHERGDAVVVYPAWAGDDLPFLKALIGAVARGERTGPTPEGFVAPSIRASTARWRRIDRGRAEVELIVIQDGGHIWSPEATKTIRRFFAT